MSDIVMELRRARADVVLVQELQDQQHDFQSLMKRVGDYVGTFARLPRFVEYYGARSSDCIQEVLEHPERCVEILEPRYELHMSYIESKDVVPY